MGKELVLSDLTEIKALADIFVKSGYFQDVREAAQAIVKIMRGRELGFGPMASMEGIYFVRGRLAFKASLLAAAVSKSERYRYEVAALDEEKCVLDFYEKDRLLGSSAFTMGDADRAGLAQGDNWKHYPRNMLFARALSNGVRWFCPDLAEGSPLYTVEELAEGDRLSEGEEEPIPIEPGPRNLVAEVEAETPQPMRGYDAQPPEPPSEAAHAETGLKSLASGKRDDPGTAAQRLFYQVAKAEYGLQSRAAIHFALGLPCTDKPHEGKDACHLITELNKEQEAKGKTTKEIWQGWLALLHEKMHAPADSEPEDPKWLAKAGEPDTTESIEALRARTGVA